MDNPSPHKKRKIMTRKYVGCHNAAEAEGKVELFNEYLGKYDQVIFYGSEEDMLNYYDRYGDKNRTYYNRIHNWETGTMSGWQALKSNWG